MSNNLEIKQQRVSRKVTELINVFDQYGLLVSETRRCFLETIGEKRFIYNRIGQSRGEQGLNYMGKAKLE